MSTNQRRCLFSRNRQKCERKRGAQRGLSYAPLQWQPPNLLRSVKLLPATNCGKRKSFGVIKIARVLVRLDHVASRMTATAKRFIVRADEKLTAFMELERTIYQFAVGSIS
jgi:hypothetical protein